MAVLKISVLCAVLALIHIAGGTLEMEINPTKIYPSLTTDLDLNCTFTYDGLSNFSSIISLIISKADQASIEKPHFSEVMSLNVFASDHVTDFEHHNAVFSGHIGALDASYIVAHWSYPSSDEGGLYKCEAVGVDSVGHSVQVTNNVLVIATKPDIDQIINRVSVLQQTVQAQQIQFQQQGVLNDIQNATIYSQAAVIDVLELQLASQNATINALQAEIHQNEKLREALGDTLFVKSDEHSGSYYMLSYDNKYFYANVCEAYCEYMGGYLTEINDRAEHDFIKPFLSSHTFATYVHIGATDEQTEGQWVYRYSGSPLTYTDWYTSQPSTTDAYDCMYLRSTYSWRMASGSCSDQYNCLCEVPTH